MKFDLELLEFLECDTEVNKLAISGSDKDLTWGEFRDEVEACKEKLLSYSLPMGHPVVIYGHKEVQFIVSMVACMSLKMPYIPVDTIYPQERLEKIVTIVKSSILINTIENKISFNENNRGTSYLLEDPIIYIIFTSGSTGEPKGVQITKSSILDFKLWLKDDFHFSQKNIFMNQAPFSFDLSVYELTGFLLFGGTIVLNSRDLIEDYIKYFERIKSYKCNTWVSTPSFISKYLLSQDFNTNEMPILNTFIFCGEVLPSVVAKRLLNNFSDAIVLNSYGPTEATVATTLISITEEVLEKYPKSLPVGYVKNKSIINLIDIDNEGIGEIEIVGDNVSIGYFNNHELNKNKFFMKESKRSFKTGDYGYFKDDLLFFANRKDDLIKLHGFRIEVEEINKSILLNPKIQDSITIALKRGTEVIKLISFIIADEVSVDDLKKELSLKLPYYMIPSDILQIEQFPYNVNHKIDKKELVNIYRQR